MKPNIKPFLLLSASLATFVFANLRQDQNSDIPPEFSSTKVSDSVSAMMEKIKTGSLKLAFEPNQGYLKAVLQELGISAESQVLVFSKTSLQSNFISPTSPRALYFNDHAYVGWIPNAPYIELIGIDPVIGPVFYTLANRKSALPVLSRQTLECFQCHYSPMTGQVPGLMARSVFAGPDGIPRFANGSFKTTATSPMRERWGGWYVTGTHGDQKHMGNEVARGDEQASVIDTVKGANVTDLSRYFDVGRYVTPHSDIVALMVVEQQMAIQNLITKASFLTRKAEKDGADLLKYGFGAEHVKEETQERIQHACEPLVQALLCVNEPKLTAPIKGTSAFTKFFSVSSPPDKSGRHLSELDLNTRLLRFSCSPMIYSFSFSRLPIEAKNEVFREIADVLNRKNSIRAYSHLSESQKADIREILSKTLPEIVPYLAA